MIPSRLALRLALALVTAAGGASLTGTALAGGPPVSRPGLRLDPQLLPPNTGPGDCVIRRVTGPGGAYRWDRVECDTQGEAGWSGFDHWGYGRPPLAVETAARGQDRYGPPRRTHADYRYAGRDADGYLVWPGKRP